jgi:hypothetical protein
LAQAVNRHDLQAVRSFIHPTFVGKTRQGHSVGYQAMVPMIEQLFAPEKDYEESVEIEEIEASGEGGKLVTRRTERVRMYDPKIFGMGIFLGLMFLLLFVLSIPRLLRVEEWSFYKVCDAVGLPVAIAVCFGLALFIRRWRRRTVRYQETWRRIEGQWQVVEEQEL